MKVSVFTVIMGEYSIEDAAKQLAQIGYDGVEWRVHPDFHIHPDELVERAAEVKRLSDEHGLEIPSLGTYTKVHEAEQIERCCLAAAAMNCSNIRIALRRPYDARQSFTKQLDEARNDLRRVQTVLEKHDVRGVFEIHHGTIAENASGMRRLLDGFPPETFGAIFDPGNMIICGRESWAISIDILGPYLAHVHVKNISWQRGDKGEWIWMNDTLQRGMVDWPEVIAALADSSYNGYLSIEDLYGVRLATFGFVGESLRCTTQNEVSTHDKLVDNISFLKSCMDH